MPKKNPFKAKKPAARVSEINKVLVFPPRVCPRCGSSNTVRFSQYGNVQYRRCRKTGCLLTFKNPAQHATPE